MKKAGDYLAAIIDANLYKKAKTYSNFFSSWGQISRDCGIDAAAGHSRVRELERGILVVEADHPGWVQILQTKAPEIINAARRRFPELDVRGVSFTLAKPRSGAPEETAAPRAELPQTETSWAEPVREDMDRDDKGTARTAGWEQIKDPELKDTLRRLKRNIEDRDKAARGPRGKK
jgi:hypothetical protein